MPISHNRIYEEQATIAGGTIYQTSLVRGFLRHIIVQSATDSTTFDFAISDGSSLNLFERESQTGELNETVIIPVQSPISLTVSNATRDELFKVYIAVQNE